MNVSNMTSDELVNRLIVSVMNYDENKEQIENFPFVKKGSFAILAQLCVGEKNDAGQYTACLTVTDNMLKQWGLEKKVLFEIAADNSQRIFPSSCQPLEEYMDITQSNVQMMLPDDVVIPSVMVLTNKQHFNGAAAMFYDPDVLESISQKMKAEKLMLLPSSINQIYCIPQKNDGDLKDFQEIFGELTGLLNMEDKLSNSILSYDNNTKAITEANGISYTLDINETAARKMEHTRR